MKGVIILRLTVDEFLLDYIEDVDCSIHLNAECEIVYCKSGSFDAWINGQYFHIGSGKGLFIMPFEYHSFETKISSYVLRFVFSNDVTPSFYDIIRNKKCTGRIFDIDSLTASFVEKVIAEEKDELLKENVLYPFCRLVLNECKFCNTEKEFTLFSKALKYMAEHYNEGITLESTAKSMGIHFVHLSRVFKNNSEYSFTQYLNLMKFSRAEYLLKNSGKTIAEVAYDSGFGSIRNFNRLFLRIAGVTPTAYRNGVKPEWKYLKTTFQP